MTTMDDSDEDAPAFRLPATLGLNQPNDGPASRFRLPATLGIRLPNTLRRNSVGVKYANRLVAEMAAEEAISREIRMSASMSGSTRRTTEPNGTASSNREPFSIPQPEEHPKSPSESYQHHQIADQSHRSTSGGTQDARRSHVRSSFNGYSNGNRDKDTASETISKSATSTREATLNIRLMHRRTICVALLVVLVGAAATILFLYDGITSAHRDQKTLFENRARDVIKEIDSAWADYETMVKWTHHACRDWKNMTTEDFHSIYQYAISDGIDFFELQFVPNVTHAERLVIEEESSFYYNTSSRPEYTNYSYPGFRGVEPDANDPSGSSLQQRSEQDFYFPILFVEPFGTFGNHLDLWSSPYEQPTIAKALGSGSPTLTPPFVLIGDHNFGNTVVLYHPGVPVVPNEPTRDLSTVVVPIHALLERASRGKDENVATYLYDVTDTLSDPTASPTFMGALEFNTQAANTGTNNGEPILSEETPYDEVISSNDRIYEEEVEVGGRYWRMVVVPTDDDFDTELFFIVFSGCLLFAASVGLAIILVLNNARRASQMQQVMAKAEAEATIVSNLFPEKVKRRLIEDATNKAKTDKAFQKDHSMDASIQGDMTSAKLISYLSPERIFGSKPIAELYTSTTLLFADLVGFTAWSSIRDPSQVFTLLEIIYYSFDTLATAREIFKVETVGDCYVAAAGMPEPRQDHAVAMGRFASDCLRRLQHLVRALDTRLGPDTGDLDARIGLHSGPVTGGVLRGEKGRFQLFGDTMNVASRMETTGVRGKIQVSEETAELLREAGKEGWLKPRKDEVHVKGKGMMKTWFLKTSSREEDHDSAEANSLAMAPSGLNDEDYKQERLIDWNVEVLLELLKKIVASNQKRGKEKARAVVDWNSPPDIALFDEVKEVIWLPPFDAKRRSALVSTKKVHLDQSIVDQLNLLVSRIAALYRSNPFHSFEHASHVAMSVMKMGQRIVEAKQFNATQRGDPTVENEVYRATFGLAHDPMTQFACVFSALIHDLDHQGVPNATLVQENDPLALKYRNKSVAEQNSIDLAWGLLQDPQLQKLRSCICVNDADYQRFRQMVVNICLATDIMDGQLGAARKERWKKAFGQEGTSETVEADNVSLHRKATIVMEHLIQASDVSHTMQHWHIYVKWNQRLFNEMMLAFKEGRIEKDPSENWYKGELGFFDFYILPLAKKLETCGVFGVSSDEYLNYAVINRKEWEKKGEKMVRLYLAQFKASNEEEKDSIGDLDLSDMEL